MFVMTRETMYAEPDPETYPEPEPPAGERGGALFSPVALMQVLPADFPLPSLIRFVPDLRLRLAADRAAADALAIAVTGADGMVAADAKCGELRGYLKAIEEHFDEPTKIAYDLHKSLTSKRGEWVAAGEQAVVEIGRRIRSEKQRLDGIAADERRKAQEEANQKAREEAARAAEEAAKNRAPAVVVESLKRQAETAVAPPVTTFTPSAPPKLANTAIVKNWTSTIAGTPREAEQQPCIADLNPDQRLKVFDAMRAVLDGKAPLALFEIGWSYINKRAKADEAAFNLPGFEAYDAGGTRGKPARRK